MVLLQGCLLVLGGRQGVYPLDLGGPWVLLFAGRRVVWTRFTRRFAPSY